MTRRATRVPDEATKRRIASRELGKANRAIKAVRSMMIALAVVHGVIALGYWLVATEARDAERAIYQAEAAIRAVVFAVFVTGAILIRRAPVPWTLAAASIQTLFALFAFTTGGVISIGFAVLLAAGCWAGHRAVVPAARLIEKHGDLRAAKTVRGEKPRPRRRPRRR